MRILTLNGGSSSIKAALFETEPSLQRVLDGEIRRIGLPSASLKAQGESDRPIAAPDHAGAVGALLEWFEARGALTGLAAVGHRVVHGGPNCAEPQRINPVLLDGLRRLTPYDPEHLPEEILLIEVLQHRLPALPQVACFDTGFHHDLPRVAQLLPIPRRYEALGVRRYGFHGLSYAYLMEELASPSGPAAAG